MIINGDCVVLMSRLFNLGIRIPFCFADPPDNIGLSYSGFSDKDPNYDKLLRKLVNFAQTSCDVMWLSVNNIHQKMIWEYSNNCRMFPWVYSFSQYREEDHANGYRPIFRYLNKDISHIISKFRIPSERQKLGDKRANLEGRVPDDILSFPRVTGNSLERKSWHPTQHPEKLIERLLLSSCEPGNLVLDLFGGTGTVHRVAKRLGYFPLTIEISPIYADLIARQFGEEPITLDNPKWVEYVNSNRQKTD